MPRIPKDNTIAPHPTTERIPAFRIALADAVTRLLRASTTCLLLAATTALLPASTIRINEFVASNGTTLADEDGDFEDWIELHNFGSEPLYLEGMGISDDPGNPFRWIFPDIVLEAGGFLVLHASGKDRREPGAPLHTNFSISADGEPLLLTRADGQTRLDEVPPVRLGRDMSYGRLPDGSGWAYFDEPTPGVPNNTTAYEAWLEPPVFSHTGGFYTDDISLTLSPPDEGATILFTLDGSEPGTHRLDGEDFPVKQRFPGANESNTGPLLTRSLRTHFHTEPIPIADTTATTKRLSRLTTTATWDFPPAYMPPANSVFPKGTVVRARALREGSLPSEIVTHTYFVGAGDLSALGFPIVAVTLPPNSLFHYENGIYTPGKIYDDWWLDNPTERSLPDWRRPANYTQRGREWERTGHIEVRSPNGDLLDGLNAGIRIHGGASRRDPLKSLRLYARSEYDTSASFTHPYFTDLHDIYGRPVNTHKRLILRSGGNDNPQTRLRDALFQTLLRPMGLDDQRHLAVLHFVNGYFWGHMDLRERLDRYYIANRYAIDPDDVAMLSLYHSSGIFIGAPQLEEGTQEDLDDFLDLMDFIGSADLADPANFAQVADAIDLKAFILYNVAQIILGNYDWPHNNNDWWRKRVADRRPGAHPHHDGRWRWILTDLDFGMGLYRAQPDHRTLAWALRDESWGEDPARVEATLLLRRLVNNPTFRERFINAFADHLATTFQPDRFVDLIHDFEDRIGPIRDGLHHDRYRGQQGSSAQVQRLIDHARTRPNFVRTHLRQEFGLLPPAYVTFNVADPALGELRVNTLRVNADTPGLPNPAAPYPFTASYYPGVPVEVEAIPHAGHVFAGWEELPGETANPLRINPATQRQLTARFRPGPAPEVVAYWHFNDTDALLTPAIATTGATMEVVPGPHTVITDGGGNGFSGANALPGDPPGRHLRLNSPLGASVELSLPTSGHTAPVLRYEVRRSNQGAGRQLLAYSLDGEPFSEFREFPVFAEDPLVHTVDFSALQGATDNPRFRVRLLFLEGDGGQAGNHRIDNLTLEALPLAPSIFRDSPHTFSVGGGWKLNGLGVLHDRWFPHVYFPASDLWGYVLGEDESGYFLHLPATGEWSWTGAAHYPHAQVLTGPRAGTTINLQNP
ncbi:MAG: CotH kinase family protein [Opitutales bacterium]|nr:CotH kinase family protein [Opitutales bacterium]